MMDSTHDKENELLCLACEIGDIDIVKKVLGYEGVDQCWADNKSLRNAVVNGHLALVQILTALPGFTIGKETLSEIFSSACEKASAEMISFLHSLGYVDAAYYSNSPIQNAAGYGNLEVVKFLYSLPEVDVTANDNYALGRAAENGHTETVRFLLGLPGVDPRDDGHYAVCMAAEDGRLDVVELLLERIKQMEKDNG